MDKIEQWHKNRWGKFTASENYKLLVGSKGGGMFGEGAMTYIKQKALQMTTAMWERPELEETKSILHGRVHEYPAYEMYVKETRNFSMQYLGDDPIFYPYELMADEAGGTPDCINITEAGTIDFGAEIKCPINPMYHYDRLKWKDQWSLKDNYPLCYTQIQNLLMFTKAQEWHFVSFDDRQLIKRYKSKIIPVFPDKTFQNNFEIRLRQAVKEKYISISETYGVDVKNRDDFARIFHAAA
jgi:hypothetical protein